MILYHGTYTDIDVIDITKSKPYKDFGKGFYLTDLKTQAEFIFLNRNRKKEPLAHEYDIVIGPIADDGVAYLLSRYDEGSYTLEELAAELEYKKLNNQYFFGTQRVVKLLKKI